MGDTLTEFLVVQIAHDDEAARTNGADALDGWRWKQYPQDAYNEIQALTLEVSKRVLAECEAKRRIVELHAIDCWVGTGPDGEDEYFCAGCAAETSSYPDGVVCPTLAALAAVYTDRPGYLDEWRRP